MKKNIVWYEINPNYFEQIALLKGIVTVAKQLSFFELVRQDLPRIKALGCTGVWLMPLYIRGQEKKKGFGSPYAVKDYQISHLWGTDEELHKLVEEAHSMGFKVICEYVPNHLAPDASFVESKEGVIYLDENGQPLHDHDWADVVKLNHSNPLVQGYTRANLLWLMKTYGFDGFRLDMAHYPLQDAQKVSSFGKGDPQFWQKVFGDSSLDSADNFWLAEVYDDRTQALYGYADHLALLKQGMIPYDKKTHDIITRKLKYQAGNLFVQERLYEELFAQAQVLHSIGLDTRQGLVPFLRMPSNHDDCPGVHNFGGVSEYLLASNILALLPGHCVIYAGDEFGLKIKPSVVGINYCDEQGNMTESNQVKLLPDSEQEIINKQIKEILNIRQKEASLQNGAFLMAKVNENTGNLSSSLVAFVRFLPAQNEIILIAANLSSAPSENWGQIKNFYPTFDFPVHEFNWKELLEWVNPIFATAGYKVLNLKSQEVSKLRKFEDEFWIGLQPLEVQVLKIIAA